jgi:hypothetical protein
MSAVTDHATTQLDLGGAGLPVLLYAGGTTGLVLLSRREPSRSFCTQLGELAESAGLSALAFAGDIPGDAALAAARGAELLEQLGVEATVLVAIGDDAAAALRAAGGGSFAAVVLIEPAVPPDELEPLLAGVPTAKLVLVRGANEAAQAAAAAIYRHAIGPTVVRHVPGDDVLSGETAAMIAEATLAFAVGTCGDGSGA